ncbi:unnamed protein product [Pleuronectes platessa]|uniref:Uncharacterized protein n=1 Tax=Pleuronectes platessa TaxID=8262 RepID=A0A9N7ZFE5_PLEPL|nr:unnamed protein product [Pleuronectes platessa]
MQSGEAIKKKLLMSPGESWPCCSLALFSPCGPLFSSPALLSDCCEAPARPLPTPDAFSLHLSLLSPVFSLCFQHLAARSSAGMTGATQDAEGARKGKETGVVWESLPVIFSLLSRPALWGVEVVSEWRLEEMVSQSCQQPRRLAV